MIAIAQADPRLREELFRETSRKMGVNEAIIEKDFWVCVILHLLFTSERWKDKLIFKGGTSLSKVYGLIERFSEDIDLILDWRELGFSDTDPWQPESNTQKDRFVKDTNPKATKYLEDVLIPVFRAEISERLGITLTISLHEDTVHIDYPRAFSNPFILPHIILEIGPLAEWTPNQTGVLSPYVVRFFAERFTIPETKITVVTAERTFWEKATILHQEYYRPADKATPKRYSRHYYDLYKMGLSDCADSAIDQIDLLPKVVTFKERFYRAPWSNLINAKPGTIHFVPSDYRLPALEEDYEAMRVMFFHEEPPFSEIIEGLRKLENRINIVK